MSKGDASSDQPFFLQETIDILETTGIEATPGTVASVRPKFGAIVFGYSVIWANTTGAPSEKNRRAFYDELASLAEKLTDMLQKTVAKDTNYGRELTLAHLAIANERPGVDGPGVADKLREAMLVGNWPSEPSDEEADELVAGVLNATLHLQEFASQAEAFASVAREAAGLAARAAYDPLKKTKTQSANRWLIRELIKIYEEITDSYAAAYRDRDGVADDPVNTPFAYFVVHFVKGGCPARC